MTETVLVVGAREGSLGAAVADLARARDYHVITAGMTDEEELWQAHRLSSGAVEVPYSLMRQCQADHVVCTVGVNKPMASLSVEWQLAALHSFQINVMAPMALLKAWSAYAAAGDATWRHYVAVSSNSAHIARAGSGPYCASKAALSMAVRVAAREQARVYDNNRLIYCYEPGLLARTPMTAKTMQEGFIGALHRMPGVDSGGLETAHVAALIVNNIKYGGQELNGSCLRVDAGEQ